MKNSKPLSFKSDKPKRPKRLKYIVGGVILVCLLSYMFGRDSAADQMAKQSTNMSPQQRERYLLDLSTASLRANSAQKALAEFYLTQENYAKAAQAYHDGSASLRDEAALNYAEAGKYDKAIIIYKNLSKNQTNPEFSYLLARSYINNNQAKLGCELRNKLEEGEWATKLKSLCDFVDKQSLNRKDIYELNNLGADTLVEQYLSKSEQKTAEDWLILARIYQKRGDLARAHETIRTALEQLPYDVKLQKAQKAIQ